MAQYDFNSGKLISATDLNGVNTVFSYDDPLERIKQIRRAAGGGPQLESQTNYTYVGAIAIIRSQDQNTTGDKATVDQTIYDGFGRPITADANEAGTFTETRTTYDALGRVASKTNPSRPNDGLNFATTYAYDALGRLTSLQTADTAKTSTSYTGNQVTVTDQAGKQRQLTYDALGRLTSVVEDPGVVPRLNYVTNYGYDALDDLISVSQGGRTFTYDSLRRLTAATNPESGTVSYVYDNAGNLTSRTDARGVTTNYTYDPLNRLQTQTYSDGTPTVNYAYDNPNDYGMGLLTQVSNGNSTTTITAYDPLGRVTASQQTTGGQIYNFAYSHNLAGALTSETFPSGRVVATGYNVTNQPITVSGTNNGALTNYVTSASYAPHGAPSQVWLGNTLVDNYAYNSRLQPTSLSTSVNNNGGNTFLWYVLNWGTTDNNGTCRAWTSTMADCRCIQPGCILIRAIYMMA